MEQWEQWFQEKQVGRTINALKKNNFEALFVPNSKAALEKVMKQITDGSTAKRPSRTEVVVILVGEKLGI